MKIKKIFCGLLAVIMTGVMLLPMTAMAAAPENVPTGTPAAYTWEELQRMEHVNGVNDSDNGMTRATGLILGYSLTLSREGSSNILVMYGDTFCAPEVTKCGFTVIRLEQKAYNSSTWKTFISFEDQYNQAAGFASSWRIAVTTGYDYRVTATHYAYRNILLTQKIDNYTTTLRT